MPDLTDQIRAWTDSASAGVSPVTVEEAQEQTPRDGRPPGRRWGRTWLAVAAVVAVVAGGAVALASTGSNEDTVTTDESPATSEEAREVAFTVLAVSDGDDSVVGLGIGTLRSAFDDTGMTQLWADAGFTDPVPTVDFERTAVLSITIGDDLCPPTLTSFYRNGNVLAPVFAEPGGVCRQPLVADTYVVALDWATTGPSFRIQVGADRAATEADRVLTVARPLPASTIGVWPLDDTTADRSSAEAAARSFVAHVLGDIDIIAATPDPDATPNGPTAVDIDLGTATTRMLTVPDDQGNWTVLQAGEPGFAITFDPPPTLDVPAMPGADTVEVLITTAHGAIATTTNPASNIDNRIALPADTTENSLSSVTAIYRTDDGTITALSAGQF